MTMICSCSNPACMLYGCQQAGRYQPPQYQPNQPGIGSYTFTPKQLTEEDVRRILREELAKAGRTPPAAEGGK